MQVKLAEVKSTRNSRVETTNGPRLICGREIDVSKPSDCQIGVMGLGLLNGRLLLGTRRCLGVLHSRRLFDNSRILRRAHHRSGRGSCRRRAQPGPLALRRASPTSPRSPRSKSLR